jgi:hypothetical protein
MLTAKGGLVTRRCRPALLPAVGVLLAALPAGAAGQDLAPAARETREQNLRAYTELLRSDLRAQKVAVITEVMQFTEDEDRAFWPLYREYEAELARLNDARLALIDAYGQAYSTLSGAQASELVEKALDLEARRTALKQRFHQRLKGALPPVTAARVLQVEHQIGLLVDLQVAASLPIAAQTGGEP